jgi:hypothetical protein
MFGLTDGFDLAIGNPPYIPIESMTQKDKAYYESRFPMLARKYDLSVVFILAVLDLLSRNGVLSYISSITWQTGENYGGVRKRLFTEAGVRLLVNLPFDVFKAAYVDTGIYLISRERSSGYLLHRFPKTETDFSLTNLPFESVPTELVQPPDFKVVLNLKAHSLLQKAKGRSVELGSISESTQGLAGNMFERTNSSKSREVFPFVASGQVYRYVLEVTDTFPTDLSDKPSLKRYYETGEKLLIRRVINREDRLMATVSSERLVFKKDVNPFLITDARFSPKYVLAVLNSRFISHLYVNTSSIATKDDFRQTTLGELRRLPIPIPTDGQNKTVTSLVERILAAKQKNPTADTSALEREIDQQVYALYGLTPEEIKIVEEQTK